jgi:hypothetical protein
MPYPDEEEILVRHARTRVIQMGPPFAPRRCLGSRGSWLFAICNMVHYLQRVATVRGTLS